MQKSGNEKGSGITNGDSPVISEPLLISTHSIGPTSELEKRNPLNASVNTSLVSSTGQAAEKHEVAETVASTNPLKIREEEAATKAQAVFRGFLVFFEDFMLFILWR